MPFRIEAEISGANGRAYRILSPALRAVPDRHPSTIRSICMTTSNIDTATPEQLAPILYAAIQRLGQLGRTGAAALAALVDEDDADFEEAAAWLSDIAAGDLRE